MILILAFSFSYYSIAQTHKTSQFTCDARSSEINQWGKDDRPLDSRTIPTDKIDRALVILDQLRIPTADSVKVTKSLNADFENSYLKWIGAASQECLQVRLVLVKTLLNTLGEAPSRGGAIRQHVKTSLAAEKFPTILAVSIDALLVEYGLAHGLWIADSAAKEKIAKLRTDLKSELKGWRDEYDSVFSIFEHDFKDASPATVKRFKALKQFEKIKVGALAELKISKKYFGQLNVLMKELNSLN